MTDEDRDKLLIEMATGLRLLIGQHLGRNSSLSNNKLREIYDSLDAFLHQFAGGGPDFQNGES